MEITPIAIALVYGFLGYKLNKNYILWGLMGLGILVIPPILGFILIYALDDSIMSIGIIGMWPLALCSGIVISLAVIGIIAYRNDAVFKRQSPLENTSSENLDS